MKPIENSFNIQLDELKTNIKMLQTEIVSKTEVIAKLESTNKAFENKLKTTSVEIDNLEQYSRRDNLVISGIAATFSEMSTVGTTEDVQATSDKVIDLCRDKLGIELSPSDISMAHRIKSNRTAEPAPIVVRFTRRSVRDQVYRARFQLKGHNHSANKSSQIFINEDLTDRNRKLFAAARKKFKDERIQSVWTSGCRILVKDNRGHVSALTSLAQLNSLASVDEEDFFDA